MAKKSKSVMAASTLTGALSVAAKVNGGLDVSKDEMKAALMTMRNAYLNLKTSKRAVEAERDRAIELVTLLSRS